MMAHDCTSHNKEANEKRSSCFDEIRLNDGKKGGGEGGSATALHMTAEQPKQAELTKFGILVLVGK